MRSLRVAAFSAVILVSLLGRAEPELPAPPRPYVEVTVPGYPYALTVAYGAVWVLTETEVVRLDRDTAQIVARLPLRTRGFGGDGLTDPLGGIAAADGMIFAVTRTSGAPAGTVRGPRRRGRPGVYDPDVVLPEYAPDDHGVVIALDARTGATAWTLPVGQGRAFDVAASPGRVFVSAGRRLLSYEVAQQGEPREREVQAEARLAHDGQVLWVSTNERLLGVDARLRNVRPPIRSRTTDVDAGPSGVWFAREDRPGLIAVRGGRTHVFAGGRFGAVASGDGVVWATDPGDGTIVRIDPATGRAISRHPGPGRQVGALAADGAEAWVIGKDGVVARIAA